MCFVSDQVLPTDESVEHKKSHRQSHRKKVLPEIYLTRLLSTKVGHGPPSFAAGGIAGCGLQREAGPREVTPRGQRLSGSGGTRWPGWLERVWGGCRAPLAPWLPSGFPARPRSSGAGAWSVTRSVPRLVWGLCTWKGCWLPQGS